MSPEEGGEFVKGLRATFSAIAVQIQWCTQLLCRTAQHQSYQSAQQQQCMHTCWSMLLFDL